MSNPQAFPYTEQRHPDQEDTTESHELGQTGVTSGRFARSLQIPDLPQCLPISRTLHGRAQKRILEQKQRPWHHPGRKTEGPSSHRTSEGSASPTKATRCPQASAKASAHPQRKWRNQPQKLMSAKHLKRLSSESHGKVEGCATDFTVCQSCGC